MYNYKQYQTNKMSNFNKREWIRHEYEAKKFQIRSRDPTKEIVYPNQAEAAVDIFKAFMIDGKVAVTLIALPQAGKTGTFLEVAYRMCTFNDDEKAIDPEQLLIITGMSDREWRWQTSNDMLTPFKNRVKHRGQFSSVPTLLKHLHDSLIIIDECHIAAEKEQSMSAMLRDAGLLNIEELRRRRIFLLEVSATPGATLYDTQNWGQDNHSIVILKESPKYVGFREFINEFRLHESYDLSQREQVVEMMNFIEGTFPDPRYHIIRLSGKKNSEETVQHIRQIANQRGWIVNHHNANNRMWDLDHIMTTPPMSHSFIIIKEFWRAGKRLCDKYVGIVHEPKTLVEDTNVTSQGLVGRLCGNDKQKGDAAPHAFCNMALIHEYLEWIDAHGDFEAVQRYRSKNLKANNGKVRSKESFVHHSNVEGVDYEEVFDNEFDITDVFSSLDMLKRYLQTTIYEGKITSYELTDGKIQYRGIPREIFQYETKEDFRRKDIYTGINKTVSKENIVCRNMPVYYEGSIQWVGIFLKAATQPVQNSVHYPSGREQTRLPF